MPKSPVTILAMLAVTLSGLAWYASQREQASYIPRDLGLFLPELEGRLNEISRVEVEAAGKERVVLERAGEDRWVLPARTGYPIDVSKLRELLRGLATAEVIEAKTANPDRHARLKLSDIDAAVDTTIAVNAFAEDEPVLGVLLGRMGQGGQYLRKIADNQTWLVNQALRPPQVAQDWLDKTLVDVKRAELSRVVVSEQGEQLFSLSAPEEGGTDFVLTPSAENRGSLNSANVNRILSALSNLRLLDLRAETPADDTLSWRRLVFVRQDGLHVEVEIRQDEDRYWMRLDAHADGSAGAPDAAVADGSGASTSLSNLPSQELAQSIHDRAAGRVFEISSYPGGGLLLDYGDLLRSQPAEDPDA